MSTLRVLEDQNDPSLQFERAWIGTLNGELCPYAQVSGRKCIISTRPGPLAEGIAYCRPVDGDPEQDWPMDLMVIKQGSSFPERMAPFTINPRILEAAKKFNELLDADMAKDGMAL